jgi:thiol-disulfide isomerase/thioredoxin
VEKEKKRMRWDKAYNRMRYRNFHAYYTEQPRDSVKIDEAFYDPLEELDPAPGPNLSIPSFYRFLDKHGYHLAMQKRSDDSAAAERPLIEVEYEQFKGRYENDSIRDLFLAANLFDRLQREGIAHTEPQLDELKASPLFPEVTDSLLARYEDWKPIQKGKEAPGFAYPNVEGDTIALSDLKGDHVYIDVWATWCGPCRKEIPHLKDLEKAFEGKDVSFVSVSLDNPDAKDRWKKMVKKKDLGGHQLYANGKAFDSRIAEDYLINSIPRFILIGPDGKIIDNNAERPSGEAEEQLKELLRDSES